MSIRTVSASPTTSNAGLNTKLLNGNYRTPPPTPTPWVRNPQWLTLPTVLSTDQKMVGLNAIFPLGNFIALVAAGDYTVDWGDGVTENFAANVVAYHEYDYANAAFNGTLTDLGYKQAIVTVTPQAGQNLTYLNLNQKHNQAGLNAYSSGFLDISLSSSELTDLRVVVSTPSSTTGLISFNLLQQFSLVNSDCKQLNNFFNAARSLQSIPNFVTSTDAPVTAAVTFTDVGDLVTLASHGFRNGDSVIFTTITSTTGITVNTTYYIINTTTDTFQVSTTYGGSAVALTTNGTGVVVYGTSMNSTFITCTALTTVPLFNTVAVTNMTSMFNNCASLTSVPLFNTASVTTMGSMFSSCSVLTTVPLFNTAAVTNMGSIFSNCSALTTVPLFNTATVTNMASMFNICRSLTTVPLFNTVAVTSMATMFNTCALLTSVPLFNTAAVTNMSSMFSGCRSLTTVPLFNTTSVTNISNMFNDCASLTSVPLFNTAAVTNMNSMFSACTYLTSVPLFNTTSVVDMSSMFSSCLLLTTVPLFNTAAVTTMSGMFSGCSALTTVPLFNTASATNLTAMFSSCSALTTVPLFNFNTAAVTLVNFMFSGCLSLTTVPLFNTAAVTNMSGMFNNCASLTSVPLFNTASVTTMAQMFQICTSLTSVPLFNTAAVTNMSSMFSGCTALTTVPALITTAVTSSANFSGMFGTCASLTKIEAKNFRFTFSVASCKLSKTALEEIFSNLPSTVAAQTLTITSNYGNPTAVSLTGTRTAGNAVILMASTANLAVGMLLTGTGINTAVAVTIQGNPTNTVTRTAHGIPDGTIVSFATIVTTTGISTYTPYYVVNATANTFQVSLTLGGAAITLTNNGSGTLLYGTFITAIVPNVSITVTVPPSASGATTLTFRVLNASIATLKNWNVTF